MGKSKEFTIGKYLVYMKSFEYSMIDILEF